MWYSLNSVIQHRFQIYKKSDQCQVTIKINKQEAGWWERLTLQEEKPAFLSPDYSRWKEQALAEKELIEKVLKNLKSSELSKLKQMIIWDIFKLSTISHL